MPCLESELESGLAASSHQHCCRARGQAGRQLGQHSIRGVRSGAGGSAEERGVLGTVAVPGLQERGRCRGFPLGAGLVGANAGAA